MAGGGGGGVGVVRGKKSALPLASLACRAMLRAGRGAVMWCELIVLPAKGEQQGGSACVALDLLTLSACHTTHRWLERGWAPPPPPPPPGPPAWAWSVHKGGSPQPIPALLGIRPRREGGAEGACLPRCGAEPSPWEQHLRQMNGSRNTRNATAQNGGLEGDPVPAQTLRDPGRHTGQIPGNAGIAREAGMPGTSVAIALPMAEIALPMSDFSSGERILPSAERFLP
eukprot:gene23586-biopygen2847